MNYEPPMLWEIRGPAGDAVGRVRWESGMAVEIDADPERAAYLQACADKVFMILQATGADDSDTGMIGRMLDQLFTEQLASASGGEMRGAPIADPTAPTEASKLARAGLPEDISPASLIEATGAGRLRWTWNDKGTGFWAGAEPGSGESCLLLGREGKQYTLLLTRNQIIGSPTVQKNGWFGRKCDLGRLWDAIEAAGPRPASAREKRARAGEAGSPAQWAPAGSAPAALADPLTEPRFRDHLAGGKVIERGRYGDYFLVAVDVSGLPAGAMRYRYRLFVLPSEGATPVLAVNHEVSAFGTAAFGVHRGGAHVNFGAAPATMSYDAFKAKAKEILAEELLGIRAAG